MTPVAVGVFLGVDVYTSAGIPAPSFTPVVAGAPVVTAYTKVFSGSGIATTTGMGVPCVSLVTHLFSSVSAQLSTCMLL